MLFVTGVLLSLVGAALVLAALGIAMLQLAGFTGESSPTQAAGIGFIGFSLMIFGLLALVLEEES